MAYLFKVNVYTFMGGNSIKLFLSPFNRSSLKGKNLQPCQIFFVSLLKWGLLQKESILLPLGINSSLLEKTPFRKDFLQREANWKIYQVYSVPLKYLCFQRAAATERYQISIEEMIHNEKQADLKRHEDIQKAREFEIHKV